MEISEHRVRIAWDRAGRDFTYDGFDRTHRWTFPEGVEILASAAPEYLGRPEHVDPEQAFVAALAGCHMLTFLSIAARRRYRIDQYDDDAVGFLEKNEDGLTAVTRIVLRPRIHFGGERRPDPEQIDQLHERAHRHCFIANSVKTHVSVESPLRTTG